MISFAGDTCPTGYQSKILSKDAGAIVTEELRSFIAINDSFVINLECPVTESKKAIVKCGPNLKTTKAALNGLKALNITHCSLANNHIMDFGDKGLEDTISALNAENIPFWGAAENQNTLNTTQYFELDGRRVAAISISEHEFSVIGPNNGGAYGLDIVDNVKLIRKVKEECDFVVLLYHGGVEHYVYPTPQQQKMLRFFIDEGADLILCQHSHIIGAIESYKTGKIYYGQGNFLFESPTPRGDWWNQGLIVSLSLDEKNKIIVSHQLIQQELGKNVSLLKMNDEQLAKEAELSVNVADEVFVMAQWSKWVNNKKVDYFSRLYGWSRLKRVIFRKLGIHQLAYKKSKNAIIRNVVECESHHQALLTYWQESEFEYEGKDAS